MPMSENERLSLWKNGQTFSALATVHFKSRDIPQFPSTQSDFDEQTARLNRLNDGLLAGKFIAFGFPEPKRIGDVPHIIPRDAWEPDEMNRNLVEVSMNNRLEYDGLYFTDIRVVSPQSQIIKTDGRPTLGPILTDISTEMKNAGDIDVSRQQKDHFAKRKGCNQISNAQSTHRKCQQSHSREVFFACFQFLKGKS